MSTNERTQQTKRTNVRLTCRWSLRLYVLFWIFDGGNKTLFYFCSISIVRAP